MLLYVHPATCVPNLNVYFFVLNSQEFQHELDADSQGHSVETLTTKAGPRCGLVRTLGGNPNKPIPIPLSPLNPAQPTPTKSMITLYLLLRIQKPLSSCIAGLSVEADGTGKFCLPNATQLPESQTVPT